MLGLFAGLALTCSLAAAENPPLRKVRLQLKWQHQFQFAGYYAAVEQGYYREAGLEVELIEAQPGRDPALTVMEGRAEFGVGDSDLLLLRAAGKPAVVLAAIFPHSPLLLLTRAASGVADLQGLHNREMMVIESEKAELLAYFKHEGVDVAGLRLRPHTLRTEDFIEGKVDTMSACSTDEPFELRQAGVGFPSFTARTGGIDFYGDNLYTTEEQIRRDPALVRAFRAASLRGWDYPLAKPAETIALIEQRYRSRLNHDHLEFEATQTAELMHPGIIQVGHMNPGRWQHIAGTYAEFGLLPSGFDLTGFLYDPDPRPNLRWLYWTLGILGVVTLAAIGWIMQLARLNRLLTEAARAAEAADAAKGRYLAFFSHEIRTP
jgi:ABC-type nitrate/sulfonate/bicarbonate transport system substrate-binding protein